MPEDKQHGACECTSRYCAQHRDIWRHYEDVIGPQFRGEPTADERAKQLENLQSRKYVPLRRGRSS
jgi:hypothetical protein